MFRYIKLLSSIFAGSVLCCIPLQASVIIDSTITGSAGAYSYSYQVNNDTTVGLLSFAIAVTGEVGSIQSPAGWVVGTDMPAPGETIVQWVSLGFPYDISAFGDLSGFLIASASQPGSVSFSTLDENFFELDGQTIGPTASMVPEPGSGMPVALAVLTALLFVGHRKRSAR